MNIHENISINIKFCLTATHDETWYEIKTKKEYAIWIIQTGTLTINYAQKQYTLHAGDVFFFYPQNIYHSTSSTGCSFLFVHFDAILGHNHQALDFYPFDGQYHAAEIGNEVEHILLSNSAFAKKEPFSELALKGSLMFFLANIMKSKYTCIKEDSSFTTKNPLSKLQPALIYIGEHLSEPIYIQDLADCVNLSEKYFITYFKKVIGMTPASYIIQAKMKKALEYLHEQSYSVKEVATLVGYADTYTFSKVFKKTYGFSPSKI